MLDYICADDCILRTTYTNPDSHAAAYGMSGGLPQTMPTHQQSVPSVTAVSVSASEVIEHISDNLTLPEPKLSSEAEARAPVAAAKSKRGAPFVNRIVPRTGIFSWFKAMTAAFPDAHWKLLVCKLRKACASVADY
jgi:hypothetical protein